MARVTASRLRAVSLAAAILWLLPGAPAQALPLGPASSIGPQATVTSTSTLSVTALTTTTVAFPDSLGSLQPPFDGAPELLFSFTREGAGTGIVITIHDADLGNGDESGIDEHPGEARNGRAPNPASTAALLFSSGIVSAAATRRRRRASRWMDDIASPSHARNEVSGKAPVALARSTCGSSYSTPLQI